MCGQIEIAPAAILPAAGQHGASGVMAARLVWGQEERFKSGMFHHGRRQRGDMTCVRNGGCVGIVRP